MLDGALEGFIEGWKAGRGRGEAGEGDGGRGRRLEWVASCVLMDAGRVRLRMP